MSIQKRASLSHKYTHSIRTEQLAFQIELNTLEAEMAGYLKELGYE